MTGIEMLMKQMGIDPKKMIADFELLKENIVGKLKSIDDTMARIEAQGARIEGKVNSLAGAEDIIPVPEKLSIYEVPDGKSGSGGSPNG
jgi:CRISPR/Cas system-associated exonuclease Cas4 (RecB family)